MTHNGDPLTQVTVEVEAAIRPATAEPCVIIRFPAGLTEMHLPTDDARAWAIRIIEEAAFADKAAAAARGVAY